jgi:ABC-type multidrug transport system fused ATPase/permease subunit
LNIVHADTGTIEINGEPLSNINIATLRHSVTFIQQEPVLFDGTIRENLDPMGEFDETAYAVVLDRIASSSGQQWALGDRVEAQEHNFSQSQ